MKALKEISAGSILVHAVFFYGVWALSQPVMGAFARLWGRLFGG